MHGQPHIRFALILNKHTTNPLKSSYFHEFDFDWF